MFFFCFSSVINLLSVLLCTESSFNKRLICYLLVRQDLNKLEKQVIRKGKYKSSSTFRQTSFFINISTYLKRNISLANFFKLFKIDALKCNRNSFSPNFRTNFDVLNADITTYHLYNQKVTIVFVGVSICLTSRPKIE